MSNLRNILKEEYKKKENTVDVRSMVEVIEALMEWGVPIPTLAEGSPQLASPTTAEEIRDLLPVLKITEDWGKIGNRDRGVIESFTARLGGEGTSVADKIQLMNQVIEGQGGGDDISEILTTMMVVEIMSSILEEFTESAGGFIFEGFIAGLFGGKSVQITEPSDIEAATGETVSAAGKPITDVVLSGRHYSLKLLGPSTGVAGSFKNMVEHFAEIDHVTYLDARRSGTNLEFSEFDITLPTFLETFYYPFVRYQKKSLGGLTDRKLRNAIGKYGEKIFAIKAASKINGRNIVKPEEFEELLSMPDLKDYGPFEIRYSDEKFSGKVKQYYGNARIFNAVQDAVAKKDKNAILNALRQTPAYKKPEQFMLTRAQTEKIPSHRDLGTLQLGDPALKKTWMAYGERLMSTIAPVYGALNSFTNNINLYFLASPTEETSRTQYGEAAISDAGNLQTSTDAAISNIEKS